MLRLAPRTTKMTKTTAVLRVGHPHSLGSIHWSIPFCDPPSPCPSLMFKILLLISNILNIPPEKDLTRKQRQQLGHTTINQQTGNKSGRNSVRGGGVGDGGCRGSGIGDGGNGSNGGNGGNCNGADGGSSNGSA